MKDEEYTDSENEDGSSAEENDGYVERTPRKTGTKKRAASPSRPRVRTIIREKVVVQKEERRPFKWTGWDLVECCWIALFVYGVFEPTVDHARVHTHARTCVRAYMNACVRAWLCSR